MFAFISLKFFCTPPTLPDIVEAPSKQTAIIDDQPVPNLECIILLIAVNIDSALTETNSTKSRKVQQVYLFDHQNIL